VLNLVRDHRPVARWVGNAMLKQGVATGQHGIVIGPIF
jgi:hypothetical protein